MFPLRNTAIALLWGLTICVNGGCGRINYDPIETASDDGGPGGQFDADGARHDGGAAGGADTTTLRFVTSSSCTGPNNLLSVPPPGIEAGSVILVQVLRRTVLGAVDVQDSAGNQYDDVELAGGDGTNFFLLQSAIETALEAGDTITVTESSPTPSAVVIAQLIGDDSTVFSSQTGKADDTSISIPFTATRPGVVLCTGGARDAEVVLSDNWNELENIRDDCGGLGDLSIFSYWVPAGQDGIEACEGSLVSTGGFPQWAGVVRSFAAAP